jgi:glutaminase
MVNMGAIVTTSLIQGDSLEIRFHRLLNFFSELAGRNLELDEAVYQSAKATGYRNRAIAYLALNHNMIKEPIDEHFDLYYRQCCILITTQDLAIMSATLANNGINPITKKQVIQSDLIKPILSIMISCGMYNFSGQWLFDVGLPAKSGVGGGIMAVSPRKLGISVFSPRLDSLGNSFRGIQVFKEISQEFKLHIFNNDHINIR